MSSSYTCTHGSVMNGQTKYGVGTPWNMTHPKKKGNGDTAYDTDKTCGHYAK